MDNRQWREFLDTAIGVPPGRVTMAAVRRRLVRRRIREAAGVLAVVVVAVVGVTAAVRVFGAAPGPAAHHRPAVPATVYVIYQSAPESPDKLILISTATNRAGKPIHVRSNYGLATTPDGKTLYAASSTATRNTVTPISTATNRTGKPIFTSRGHFVFGERIAITP